MVSPHSHYNLTGQPREAPGNKDIPTETQQLNRFRRRDGECSEISRDSHDRKRHPSDRSLSTSEFSNFSFKIISARLLEQGASD